VTTDVGCDWSAVSNRDWLIVTGGSPGSGNGEVSFTVSENSANDDRVGTIAVNSQVFTVTQSGSNCVIADYYGVEAEAALYSPGDGDTNVPLLPTFSWQCTDDQVYYSQPYYHVRISAAPFTSWSTACLTTATSCVPETPLSANTQYQVHVWATPDQYLTYFLSDTPYHTFTVGNGIEEVFSDGFETGSTEHWSSTVSADPSITVTSPTSISTWLRGNTYTIRWNSSGVPENVSIQLFYGDNSWADETIVSSTPNDGSYSWALPVNGAIGAVFKIRVSSTTRYSSVHDYSQFFSISPGG
jgi:hypothetical protein